ncbi:MAG: glycosyltransferase family 4 protein [Candidatus Omnitrophica bacterium]|nr:glycosyltransferase family 4 protein [Candidatus Omnitrophota bacterium]
MNLEGNELVFVTRERKDLPGARYRAYNFSKYLNSQGIKSQVFSYADTIGALSGDLERFLTFKDKIVLNIKAIKLFAKIINPIFIIQRFNYHSLAPYLYSKVKKIDYIFDLDDWEFREDITYLLGIFPKSKAEFLSRTIAREARVCFAGSRFLEDYLKNVNPETYYLTPGIDLDVFSSLSDKNGEVVKLAWLGTMFRKEDFYNLNLLFDIVSKMDSNFHLKIIGSGIYINEVKSQAEKLKIKNISFTGWVRPESIPELLNEIHIGVYPIAVKNKFMMAKFPVKVLEFMAKGIPVVATNFGEVASIIKNGDDGFLTDDILGFREALYVLIKNKDLRKKMGIKARKKIENEYNLKVQGERLLGILKNV